MSDRLICDIEILAGLFKAGGWKEIRIEGEGLGLLLSNDRLAPSLGADTAPAVVPVPPAPASPVPAPPASAPPASASVSGGAGAISAPPPVGAIDPEWTAVKAPNLGTFYRAPKPGAAPFVEVGQRVEPSTEICLIEVMKLFTSVQAGVAGTVRHIAVADAELVEGGQALIYIERE